MATKKKIVSLATAAVTLGTAQFAVVAPSTADQVEAIVAQMEATNDNARNAAEKLVDISSDLEGVLAADSQWEKAISEYNSAVREQRELQQQLDKVLAAQSQHADELQKLRQRIDAAERASKEADVIFDAAMKAYDEAKKAEEAAREVSQEQVDEAKMAYEKAQDASDVANAKLRQAAAAVEAANKDADAAIETLESALHSQAEALETKDAAADKAREASEGEKSARDEVAVAESELLEATAAITDGLKGEADKLPQLEEAGKTRESSMAKAQEAVDMRTARARDLDAKRDEEIAASREKIKAQGQKIESMEHALTAYNAQIGDLLAKHAELESKVSEEDIRLVEEKELLEAELQEANRQLPLAEEKFDEARWNFNVADAAFKRLDSETEQQNSKVAELKDRYAELQKEMGATKLSPDEEEYVTKAYEDLEHFHANVAAEKENVAELQRRLDRAKEEAAKIQKAISDNGTREEELNARISEADKTYGKDSPQAKELRALLKSNQEDLKALFTQNLEYQARSKETEEEVAKRNVLLEQVRKELRDRTAAYDANPLFDRVRRHFEAEEEARNVAHALEQEEKTLSRLKDEEPALRKKALEDTALKLKDAKCAYEDAVGRQVRAEGDKARLAEVEPAVEALLKVEDELAQATTNQESFVKSLEEERAANVKAVDEATARVAELDKALNKALELKENAEDRKFDLVRSYKDADAELARVREAAHLLSRLTDEKIEARVRLTAMQNQLRTSTKALEDAQAELMAAEAMLSERAAAVADNEAKAKDAQEALTSARKNEQKQTEVVEEARVELLSAKSNYEELARDRGALLALRAEVAGRERETKTLEMKAKDAKARLEDLNEGLRQAQARHEELRGALLASKATPAVKSVKKVSRPELANTGLAADGLMISGGLAAAVGLGFVAIAGAVRRREN